MLRARHAVALAGDIAAVEAHGRGGGFDLASVVGVVTDANQVDHDSVWENGSQVMPAAIWMTLTERAGAY